MAKNQSIDQHKLHKYLNEHLLGSRAGLQHFQAASETWSGTHLEPRWVSLRNQVEADQKDLRRILDALDPKEHILLKLATPLLSLIGKINPFNPLRLRRITMAQVQIDVLTGLLNAKLRMWQTLLLLQSHEPRLDASLLDDLAQRAESQIAQLIALSDESWLERFRS